MPRLKLHSGDWVALPDAFRRRLGLKVGDKLEAELVGDTIVLRPAARAGTSPAAEAEEGAAAAAPAPSILAANPAAPPATPAPGPAEREARRRRRIKGMTGGP